MPSPEKSPPRGGTARDTAVHNENRIAKALARLLGGQEDDDAAGLGLPSVTVPLDKTVLGVGRMGLPDGRRCVCLFLSLFFSLFLFLFLFLLFLLYLFLSVLFFHSL